MNKKSPEVERAVKIIKGYPSGAVIRVEVPRRYRTATFRAAIRRYLPVNIVKKLSLEGRVLWVKMA